jgi:hypothetical protein
MPPKANSFTTSFKLLKGAIKMDSSEFTDFENSDAKYVPNEYPITMVYN